MKELKLSINPRPNSIEEFVDNIKSIKNSFNISKINDKKYSVDLIFKYHNFLIHSASPAISYVTGVIDESVIGNDKPTIKITSSKLFRVIQFLIVCFGIYVAFAIYPEWDSFILMFELIILIFLAFNYCFYKFGQSLFIGRLIEEIEN